MKPGGTKVCLTLTCISAQDDHRENQVQAEMEVLPRACKGKERKRRTPEDEPAGWTGLYPGKE